MRRRDMIPWAGPLLLGKEKQYIVEALSSTWISGGEFVDRFEKEFTRHNGSRYGVSTSNGTTALQLAMLALDIGPGDEVIVPGYTFVAPVNMVIESGARPVYADIDPYTWCIDPASIERCITVRTKAVIPVHIYGNVCDMAPIRKMAQRRGICIVEDVAEAAFSRYRGAYAGTLGTIGCFSFQATKTITMGEGGFVVTNNRRILKKMQMIRNHGMREGKRYWHDVIGYNFRLTNIQAAMGCAQLENIGAILDMRKRMYGRYRNELEGEAGIRMQRFAPEVDPAVWAIAVKISPRFFKGGRDTVMRNMFRAGIEVRPGFYPFNILPLYKAPKLRVSEDVGLNVISLPSHPQLSERQIRFICDTLKKMRSK